jgi:hypothetical protein
VTPLGRRSRRNLFLEKDQHEKALEHFSHAKIVLENLGRMVMMLYKHDTTIVRNVVDIVINLLCSEKVAEIMLTLLHCFRQNQQLC